MFSVQYLIKEKKGPVVVINILEILDRTVPLLSERSSFFHKLNN